MNFSAKSLTAAILVIGSITLGYFLIWPKWTEYSQARASLSAAQEQQERLKLAQAQLVTFLNEYQSHSADANTLNQSLPLSKTQIHNVLNQLDTLTATSGLTLGQFTVLERPENDQLGAADYSVQSIDLSISGSGPYASLKNFIASLEANLRIMDITGIVVSREDNLGLRFTLEFRTYYQQ